jgi:hypothetical protein
MTYPVDDNGNPRVDFAWGNMPMQPDQQRANDPDPVYVVDDNQPQDRGWSRSSKGLPSDILSTTASVNVSIGDQGNDVWWEIPDTRALAVPADDRKIATTEYNGFPGLNYGTPYGDTIPNVVVPNLVGLTEAAATTALTNASLTKGTVSIADNVAGANSSNNGKIKSQIPSANSPANTGSAVNLTKYEWTPALVSGGTITSDSTYWYHTFLASDTLSVTQSSLDSCEMLLVGGGGSGSAINSYLSAGGGGAGITLHSGSLNIGSYAVTIGAGGASGAQSSRYGYETPAGQNGTNTTVGSIATGHFGNGSTGTNYANVVGGTAGINSIGVIHTSNGGRGGAGAGADASGNTPGIGENFSVWAAATTTGDSGYYAGGGGAAGTDGALGGGGYSTYNGGYNSAQPGDANTGGGGGAVGQVFYQGISGAGGSGIAIIRYPKSLSTPNI